MFKQVPILILSILAALALSGCGDHAREPALANDGDEAKAVQLLAGDALPMSFFDGDWYFARTVIDASSASADAIGDYESLDKKSESATKIRFVKSMDALRAVNIGSRVVTAGTADEDNLNLTTVLEIPAEWQGGPSGATWRDRPMVTLAFQRVRSLKENPDADAFESVLKAAEEAPGYFSFTLQKNGEGKRVKYSFLRVRKDGYEPRAYSAEEQRLFGFFQTRNFLSRFNPKLGTIDFHFASGTPDWLRETGKEAIANWDDAFKKAGVPTRIRLRESDAELGDIRFNTLHFVEAKESENEFGNGPSIIDPDTGEIVSATANVHVGPIRERVLEVLRRYSQGLLRQESPIRGGIHELCPEFQPGDRVDPEGKCVQALLKEKVLSTLVHELGHDFGLRHNFMGSVDRENYSADAETSSVMDYAAFDDKRPTRPGSYDVAALRFGYGVESRLQPGKHYLYCTDEDFARAEPLCFKYDSGSTPDEVAAFLMGELRDSLAANAFRAEGHEITDPSKLLDEYVNTYLIPLKSIYDEWRFRLARFVGVQKAYLEDYSIPAYLDLLRKMQADSAFQQDYALYRPAAKRIFRFFKDLAEIPDRYCVTEMKKDGISSYQLRELSEFRRQVFVKWGVALQSCLDPSGEKELAPGETVVGDFGFELADTRYSLDPRATEAPLDAFGIGALRLRAADFLAGRISLGPRNANAKFFPNFYDEPDFRDALVSSFLDRVLNGVSLSTSNPFVDQRIYFDGGGWVPQFAAEKGILEKEEKAVLAGLAVPGRPDVSAARLLELRSQKSVADKLSELEVVSKAPENGQAAQSFAELANGARLAKDAQRTRVDEFTDLGTALADAVKDLPILKTLGEYNDLMTSVRATMHQVRAIARSRGIDPDNSSPELESFWKKDFRSLKLTNPISREVLAAILGQLTSALPQAKTDYQKFQENAAEYSAQREILMQWVGTTSAR